MSHQEAKRIARQVVADLLANHPPGMVVMVLQYLKQLLRATKDITALADPAAGADIEGEK